MLEREIRGKTPLPLLSPRITLQMNTGDEREKVIGEEKHTQTRDTVNEEQKGSAMTATSEREPLSPSPPASSFPSSSSSPSSALSTADVISESIISNKSDHPVEDTLSLYPPSNPSSLAQTSRAILADGTDIHSMYELAFLKNIQGVPSSFSPVRIIRQPHHFKLPYVYQ